jgi:N-acetyl-gamma-glutamylphosphate reductase
LAAALPTGASAEALARVPKDVKIVDIGGDHRYVEGSTSGQPRSRARPASLLPRATTGQCLDAARRFYAGAAFVRVTDKPPQTKWATGSNLASAADPERNLVIAMGVVDNLGKGAAGQAVQNSNLICGPTNAG